MYVLSNRSQRRLHGIHKDLVMVVNKAIEITPVDFSVLEGVRTPERQRQLYESGASKTLNSRHMLTNSRDGSGMHGHAVDLGAWVAGTIRWDWPLYHKIADAMIEAANLVNVPIEWGGHWSGFPDGPHFQLPRELY